MATTGIVAMPYRYVTSLFALALCSGWLAPSASIAAGAGSFARSSESSIRRIVEGQNSLAPFASVKFCLRNTDQCADTAGTDVVALTEDLREQLLTVNSGINRAITPHSDPAGQDIWSVDVTSGDCEDYALTKRKHLLTLGWPSRALRIAVAVTPAGEGHAVLIVKTSEGDLVLDNRTSQIRDWTKTDLRWLKIQTSNPKIWAEIGGSGRRVLQVSSKPSIPPLKEQANNDIGNW